MDQGIALFKLKQMEECLPYFESVIEYEARSPRHVAKAHYYIGEVQFGKRDYELALFHYDMSIELNPNDFQVYFDRGYLRQKLRMSQPSIDDFTKSIMLNPNFPSAYHNRGVAYKQNGMMDLAVDDFRRALTTSISHQRTKKSLLDLLMPKAQRFIMQCRFEEALAVLDECAQLDPVPCQVFIDRAQVYTELGRHEDAVDDLTLALQRKPRSTDVLKSRASSLTRLGCLRKAMEDYVSVLDVRPSQSASRGIASLLNTSPISLHRAPFAEHRM
jgi:tetratricopeptide (TPR) repeat protein